MHAKMKTTYVHSSLLQPEVIGDNVTDPLSVENKTTGSNYRLPGTS